MSRNKKYFFYFGGLLWVPAVFLASGRLLGHNVTIASLLDKHLAVGVYILLWWLGSLILVKWDIRKNVENTLNALLKKNLVIHAAVVIFYYYMELLGYKWWLLLGFSVVTFLEAVIIRFFGFDKLLHQDAFIPAEPSTGIPLKGAIENEVEATQVSGALRLLIADEVGENALQYLQQNLSNINEKTVFLATESRFNILQQPDGTFDKIVNLKPLNKVGRINKFLEAINEKLPDGGHLAGFVETYEYSKDRILNRYPRGINYVIHFAYLLWNRIFPKIYFLRAIYFVATAGKYREVSKAEIFGRLYSCGFSIVNEEVIEGKQYFITKKVKEPVYDEHPTYGPLIRLRRKGENGKMIGVYKLRTMYPYSEYLQEYVYQRNQLDEGGKFKDDFRVTGMGKFFRKFWLDELPMFLNVLKGEMKIVGVRPLSNHYFSLYHKELQEKRSRHKPGLIPPFYVDLPSTLEEIMESEMRYLEEYEQSPWATDWTYFWKAMHNIFIKKARSK